MEPVGEQSMETEPLLLEKTPSPICSKNRFSFQNIIIVEHGNSRNNRKKDTKVPSG